MDCYIIRIYRHITGGSTTADEIAGLVERVGEKGGAKPFSSYQSLVHALRQDVSAVADASKQTVPATQNMKLVHARKT